MQRNTDTVDASSRTELRRIECDVSDRTVQVTISESDDNDRIFVKTDHFYEFIVEDEWAHPHWTCYPIPEWMESLLAGFGVRGIRNAGRNG